MFSTGHLAAWIGAGILLPLWEYFALRSRGCSPWSRSAPRTPSCCSSRCDWFGTQRVRQVDHVGVYGHPGGHRATDTGVAASAAGVVMVPVSMVPGRLRPMSVHGAQAFVVITTVCALVMALLARFTQIADAVHLMPCWIETAFIVIAVPFNVFT